MASVLPYSRQTICCTTRTLSQRSVSSAAVSSAKVGTQRRGMTSTWPGASGFKLTVARVKLECDVKKTWVGLSCHRPNCTGGPLAAGGGGELG
eukprot:CAMPEP_0181219048 /NCGR_PEP_ID=MMETSP1096-20121128/28038_1 /TAXON_ID=156174 ORGANISM="Chrysochromulina ericina, Strain CCMP281" /NCGR_SAMPLE_ID=MMETSP1096 /ASSEMBLY_ACC=CAM_ASM_000453 /LENGTH=92 /DNA_ID=CAMNT_0023311343 /DNA_START=572 /DNA_END=846 /DNA_ORIENTATION=+